MTARSLLFCLCSTFVAADEVAADDREGWAKAAATLAQVEHGLNRDLSNFKGASDKLNGGVQNDPKYQGLEKVRNDLHDLSGEIQNELGDFHLPDIPPMPDMPQFPKKAELEKDDEHIVDPRMYALPEHTAHVWNSVNDHLKRVHEGMKENLAKMQTASPEEKVSLLEQIAQASAGVSSLLAHSQKALKMTGFGSGDDLISLAEGDAPTKKSNKYDLKSEFKKEDAQENAWEAKLEKGIKAFESNLTAQEKSAFHHPSTTDNSDSSFAQLKDARKVSVGADGSFENLRADDGESN